jgi:GTP-binding protein
MTKRLKLALVGRPNVGKSALFNRICGKRIAIVDEAEGITRDRLYADAEYFGRAFQVIDTGGISPKSALPFQEEVSRQAEIALEEADTIVMVVDSRIGVTPVDELVAKILLRKGKPVCLAVNKIDDFSHHDQIHQFYSLGISSVVGVSASQGYQMAELLEAAFKDLSLPEPYAVIDDKTIRVAIIGRPNVGKSTLINHLLDDQRCIVSPIAGTTRDSVDVEMERDGVLYTLIDTAGIRRKNSEHEVVDKFAAIRTERAIERAQICLLMIDATEGMTVEEKRIAHLIDEQGKGCILLFNKWDAVKGFRMEHCLEGVRQMAPFLSHCPTLFMSALTGRNTDKVFPYIVEVFEALRRRVTTGELNQFVEKVLQKYHPPMLQGKRLRIYYMTQVDIEPPRFVLFVNRPELMTDTYKKYMINQFRDEYRFSGIPLTFSLKGKIDRHKDRESPNVKRKPQEKGKKVETWSEKRAQKKAASMAEVESEF